VFLKTEQENVLPAQTQRGISQGRGDNPKQLALTVPTEKMGTGSSNGTLKAAERIAWYYVGRLDHTTTVEDLTTYMADKGVSKVKECKELQTKG
jgi:hypothetical protein